MSSQYCARRLAYSALAITFVFVMCAFTAVAQQTSKTITTHGQPEQQVTVQNGEVVYVSGNDLVVRNLDTGEVTSFLVPDTARATVDGREVSVHDLKPGMKLQRTITTTTMPSTVTTVQTVQGRVWQITPPTSVILTLPDGTNQRYRIPKDQKFTVNGQETDAFHLKKGMNVSATVVTEVPKTLVAEQKTVTGQMPAPPPTPPMVGALLIIERPAPAAAPTAPTSEVAAAQPGPAKLPQTGSELPLLGLIGLLLSGASLGVKFLRR